jgi:hypothetical protein
VAIGMPAPDQGSTAPREDLGPGATPEGESKTSFTRGSDGRLIP